MELHNERRAAPRFDLSAGVRFLLRGEEEGAGRLLNISECGLALVTDTEAKDGDEIIVYPDGLGRIPGRIVRAFDGGFAVGFTLSRNQRETMKDRIAAAIEGLPYFRMSEIRSSVRIRYNIETHVWLEGGGEPTKCVLVDLSRTGCRVKCDERPEIGAPAVIGALKGVVRRHTEDGFAVEFVKPTMKPSVGGTGGRKAQESRLRTNHSPGAARSRNSGKARPRRGGAGKSRISPSS